MAEVLAFTDANFEEEVLKSDVPVLVEFFATWCTHCRRIKSLIDETAQKYEGRLKVGRVDVFAEDEVPRKYRILSTPTVIVFRNGEEAVRLVGSAVREGLKDRLEDMLPG